MSHTATATPAKPATNGKGAGRPKGAQTKRIDTSGLDLSLITAPLTVTAAESAEAAPTRERERSAEQRAMDAVIPRIHKAWNDAGSPAAWAKLPKAKYPVAPDKADALRYLIRKAGEFHGVRIRFGDSGVRDANGNELVIFAVVNKRPRTVKK